MPTLAAAWYRGGTSKCWLFDHDAITAFGQDREAVSATLAQAFGAADPRQIDGVGGATSTTSKAAVIRATPDGPADLEYDFAQVGIGSESVEWGSNCGNCATAIGLYAVTEGLVAPQQESTEVRMWNTNTSSLLVARIATPGGQVPMDGDARVPGSLAQGVPVDLVFEKPAGAMTGQLFPTGSAATVLQREDGAPVTATMVDAGAPATLFRAADLGLTGSEDLEAFAAAVPELTILRRQAALQMGLAQPGDPVSHAVPKVGIVGPAADYTTTTGEQVRAEDHDISVRMVSMLAPHPAIGLTSAVAAAAACVDGSVVAEAAGTEPAGQHLTLRIGTAAGVVTTDVELDQDGTVQRVSLRRAARRIAHAAIDLPQPAA
ncbi:PrpF domain-containing protein [Luteococcus peritonei]|uniref:PrpF domain-containing protein n=1 Tax=Luteococcus peritonei TaxID=88874 RepID=A0ABW4RS68_9ACTN